MPWWVITLVSLLGAGCTSFWGWLAVKVIDQGRKLVQLEARINLESVRINMREKECESRIAWLRAMDGKLSEVSENTAAIRGALEERGAINKKR